MFKLWLAKAEVDESFDYLQADSRKEFINATFQHFCKE